jgi:hypothetical protein
MSVAVEYPIENNPGYRLPSIPSKIRIIEDSMIHGLTFTDRPEIIDKA